MIARFTDFGFLTRCIGLGRTWLDCFDEMIFFSFGSRDSTLKVSALQSNVICCQHILRGTI